jgi:glycogen operon protein
VFPDTPGEAYRPFQSLNYVTSHDGLTLFDLVSYNSPESWNCGTRDGESDISDEVITLRKKQIRNFVCLLMLSNGTPMFRAGDEFLQTQDGEINPYNVDGPLTWLNWARLQQHIDIARFFQRMIDFRKGHPSLARSLFWRDDVKWYGPNHNVDWSHDSRTLAWCVHGASLNDSDIYVMVNSYWEPLTFTIQENHTEQWKRIIDTSLFSPDDFIDFDHAIALASLSYRMAPHSIVVLVKPSNGLKLTQ